MLRDEQITVEMVIRSGGRNGDYQELYSTKAWKDDQQNRLLHLRMPDEMDAGTFGSKSRELQDCEAKVKLERDAADRSSHEIIDTAVKAFELLQTLRQRWLTVDFDAKRRILKIRCLNWTLDVASLLPHWDRRVPLGTLPPTPPAIPVVSWKCGE